MLKQTEIETKADRKFDYCYTNRVLDPESYIGDREIKTKAAGGNGGHAFSEIKNNTRVYRIEFNYNKGNKLIKGLKLWYGDGTNVTKGRPHFGKSGYEDITVDFKSNVSTLELFKSSYRNGRLGGIILNFEDGKEAKIGNVSGSPKVIDTEGGRILGIWGRDGADIDKLGFIISEHPVTWRIEPDEKSWSVKNPEVSNVILQTWDFDECLQDDPVDCHANYNQTLTRTTSYEGGFRIQLGAKVSFTAAIPVLISGEWEVSFEAETSHTWGNSESHDIVHEADWSSNVGPHERTKVEAIGTKGSAVAEGKVSVIATYKDGTKEKFDNQEFSTRDADTFSVKITSQDILCTSSK